MRKKNLNLRSLLYSWRLNHKDNSSFKIAYLTINDGILKPNIKLNIKFLINTDVNSMHFLIQMTYFTAFTL